MDCQLQTVNIPTSDLDVDPGWNSEGFPPLTNDIQYAVNGPEPLQQAPSMLDEKFK